jgi:uncharacterized YigZ family protein
LQALSLSSYLIPSSFVTTEQTIKQSRFICCLGHGDDRERLGGELNRLRALHPRANHICWAYIAGPPGSLDRRMSDDGEPRGTAGKPMLTVLDHSGFGEIWSAVIRYFGGIKLGKGGLIRAYTTSVQQALALVNGQEIQPMLQFQLHLDYNLLPVFEQFFAQSEVEIIERTFAEKVLLELLVPKTKIFEIKQKISEISGGTIQMDC